MSGLRIALILLFIAVIIAGFIAMVRNGVIAYKEKKSLKYALRVAVDTIFMDEFEFYHKYR